MKLVIIFVVLLVALFNLAWSLSLPQKSDAIETPQNMFFFEQGDDHPLNRTKRQLMQMLSSVISGGGGAAKSGDASSGGSAPASGDASGGGGGSDGGGGGGEGSSLSNLIPGFSEYGPAFMSLINNFLGFMKCCKPILVPNVIAKLLMKCSDDLTNKFFIDSGFLNRTEMDKKVTIFLKSPSLSGFFEAEFCAVKCVLGRMKLLGPDGLPIPAKMNSTLLMIMAKQNATLIPAFNQCTAMYQTELANITASKKQLSDSDRCWASSAFVECMYRQIIQVCVEDQIEAGSLCLQKMSDYFWSEMPKQVGRFFSVVKSMVDIL